MPPLADALARTRLRPPRLRAVLVQRPALLARLQAALCQARLVLLSAPAGYGKTALLTLALQGHDGPCAWVSADEDDDLPRLLAALFAALDPLDLPWRVDPEALVQAVQQGQAPTALAALVNALDAAEAGHGVIVIDDLHRLSDPAVHPWLTALVERLPAGWTLVLASRQDPPLALARWLAAGEALVLRQDSLRFDREELAALCDQVGVPPTQAEPLLARTAGWPAGVRLGLLALQHVPPAGTGGATAPGMAPAGLPAPSAVDPALFDYLASEVLAQLPVALQQFLRRCAVLPLWSPRRCAAVSGDAEAARWLDEIERRGLFVSQLQDDSDGERVFLLHDLLRDCLLHLLQRQEPALLPQLLQRAAAVEPDVLRRVALLQRAGAWDAAEQALCALGADTVGRQDAAALQALLRRFPPAQLARSAPLQWLRGLVAWVHWHWSEMHAALVQAQALAQTAGDAPLARRARAYLALAANALEQDAWTGPAALAPLAAEADAETRLCAHVAWAWWHYDHAEFDAVAAHHEALLDLLQGVDSPRLWYQTAPTPGATALPGMQAVLLRWSRLALQHGGEAASPLRATALLVAAWCALWAGRVHEAEQTLAEAEADTRWLGDPPTLTTPLCLGQALLAAWRGDAATVRATMERLLPLVVDAAQDDRPRLWRHLFGHYGARMAATVGDAALLQRCAAVVQQAGIVSRRPIYHVQQQVLQARLADAAGDLDTAVQRWRAALQDAARIDLMGQAAEGRLRLAQALCSGPAGPAAAHVEEAATLVRAAVQQAHIEGQPARLWMAGSEVLDALTAWPWGTALDPDTVAALHRAATGLKALRAGADHAPAPVAAHEHTTVGPADRLDVESTGPGMRPPGTAHAALDALSQREREVLALIAAGDSNKHIARALDLSPHTVKRHVANILDKLGLASRGQAAACWRGHGAPP